MSVTTEASAGAAGIRPFTIEISEADEALRARISATRWPERETGEQCQAPRTSTERAYPRLIHYDKVDKGGHLAASEQPQLFSEEVRAGFRSLR